MGSGGGRGVGGGGWEVKGGEGRVKHGGAIKGIYYISL